jgi:peptide/nickel transport system substrate-binding protein
VNKKLYIVIGVLLFAILVLSACSNAMTTSSAAAQPSSSTGQPKTGGILKIAIPQEGHDLGDHSSVSLWDKIDCQPAYERLARYDSKAQAQPWLADSWTIASDVKSITVKLKKGIKFQDGSDFNAAAVKWNWEELKRLNSGYADTLGTVDVIDDYTVRANLSQPDSTIVTKLLCEGGFMASPASWSKNGNADWGKSNPVGTGAFIFVSYPTGGPITYKKNPNYWQPGKPYLDGIEISVIPDEVTRDAAFRAGEVDVNMTPTVDQIKAFSKDQYNIKSDATFNIDVLVTDASNADSPFSKLQVRQALTYAVDSQALVNNFSTPGLAYVTNQWALPSNWAWSPNAAKYPFNVQKAKELLTAAGYPNGFSTKIMCNPSYQLKATAIQAMLKDVGIIAAVETYSGPGLFEFMQKGWKNSILYFGMCPDTDMTMRMSWLKTSYPIYPSQYHSAEVDKLIDDALAAPDLATKQARTWKVQDKYFGEQLGWTCLFYNMSIGAVNKKVQNAHFYDYEDMQWWPEGAWIK